MLEKHRADLSSVEEVDEMDCYRKTYCMVKILRVVMDRLQELETIWRRQRVDVKTQMAFYANGIFKQFYDVREQQSVEEII